jgi:hypothetical protein
LIQGQRRIHIEYQDAAKDARYAESTKGNSLETEKRQQIFLFEQRSI